MRKFKPVIFGQIHAAGDTSTVISRPIVAAPPNNARQHCGRGSTEIAFWDYLGDRLAIPGAHTVPRLPEIILARAQSP
jgi:hypothetical protein